MWCTSILSILLAEYSEVASSWSHARLWLIRILRRPRSGDWYNAFKDIAWFESTALYDKDINQGDFSEHVI